MNGLSKPSVRVVNPNARPCPPMPVEQVKKVIAPVQKPVVIEPVKPEPKKKFEDRKHK